jgi:hypothetical protein
MPQGEVGPLELAEHLYELALNFIPRDRSSHRKPLGPLARSLGVGRVIPRPPYRAGLIAEWIEWLYKNRDLKLFGTGPAKRSLREELGEVADHIRTRILRSKSFNRDLASMAAEEKLIEAAVWGPKGSRSARIHQERARSRLRRSREAVQRLIAAKPIGWTTKEKMESAESMAGVLEQMTFEERWAWVRDELGWKPMPSPKQIRSYSSLNLALFRVAILCGQAAPGARADMRRFERLVKRSDLYHRTVSRSQPPPPMNPPE